MVPGEADLRRKMKADPLTYPRWIFGAKVDGVLIQKVFPRKGVYTGKGQGKKVEAYVNKTFPSISTIAFLRSQVSK